MALGSSPARFASSSEEFSYTGTAGASAAGPAASNLEVMILLSTDGYVRITKAGTVATADGDANIFVTARTYLVFACEPSSVVSVIRAATSGTAYITWLS